MSRSKMTGKIAKKCSYFGPMNAKQIRALLMTLTEYDLNESATIGNGTVKQRFKIKDIIQYVNGIYNRSSFMDDVWANLQIADNNELDNPLEIDI